MRLLNSMTINRSLLLGTILLSLGSTGVSAAPTKHWSTAGFDEPESVLAHPSEPVLFVSNINGQPTELNGKGYISLLSDEGSVIRHVWVMGMNAPKGMAIYDNLLYVADMQALHIVDYKNSALVKSITVPSSVMLNDVVTDDGGVVYVSDLLGGGIYRYDGAEIVQWIPQSALPHPNGLFFKDDRLIVATWGEGLNDDFSTDKLGSLFEISIQTKSINPYQQAQNIGNLDGIAMIDESIIVNDWMNGNVFEYRDNAINIVFNAGKHAADISSKGDVLYVPMMFSQRIDAYQFNK